MEAPLQTPADAGKLAPLVGEYRRRRPHDTVLHLVVREHYSTFAYLRDEEGRPLPGFVRREFERFLTCGDLAEGFARVRCASCGYDRLVAFSCKRRGWCPSCVGRRMNGGAAFLTDRLIGDTPVRHWVLSLPRPPRYLLAYDAVLLGEVVNAFVVSGAPPRPRPSFGASPPDMGIIKPPSPGLDCLRATHGLLRGAGHRRNTRFIHPMLSRP